MQNILLDTLLYENFVVTITEQFLSFFFFFSSFFFFFFFFYYYYFFFLLSLCIKHWIKTDPKQHDYTIYNIIDNINGHNSYQRLPVLKPHQFDNKILCLLKRHGQCIRKTILHNIIISLQFRKKRCFHSTEVTGNLVQLR